jgi:multidrug efflux pump subunit AcrA (membrane-fusion protein)
MLDAKDKERLQRSAERQAQLQEQAQQLAEQMAEMQKAAPLFGQKHQQQLDAAQQAMGQASQQLKSQGQPRSERGGLRRARQSQSQALQQLQGLKDAMEQMGKESGGGGGMPMPLPHGGSPGSERSEGQRGKSNRDDVKIPDGSDFKVKDAFRKDILDAMREGAPGEWAGEVKRYYEELIK